MKNFTLLCITFICTICTFTSAQAQNNLDELLTRLNQNHRGAVTDVFTQEEITVLRQHFDAKNGGTQNTASLGGGVELFAPENVNGYFGHYNSGDPTIFNMLGNSGTTAFDGAGSFNPVNGHFFVVDDAGNTYDLDPDTGVYTFLGVTNAPNGENFTGLEFNPMDNHMYAISTDGDGSTSISTINTSSLEVDLKGSTGLTLGIALAIDLSGMGYAFDIDTDAMYRINLSNGNATELGPIGFNSSFGQGLGFDRANGNLYMSAFNNDAFQSELRTVNTTTGGTTFVGGIGSSVPGGGTLQFGWTGVIKPPLGVEDEEFAGFKLYPNPTNELLNVTASISIETIEIYNLMGQSLVKEELNDTSGTLSLSHLPTGIYMLTATINNRQASFKFIKN